ncbi:Glucosidase 2 subunit beta [Tetrabaena socialis]|uniref:Glucosidase 2 subunit beta n=1 Tax=Tetrabaena socialis TaxID=47790 RepID=A0A2J8ACI2_9CHLO|nr:Glucosidase 2 subunit beta [Tetrabaena socialis]|eukprot:PNH10213.1 Glucosidase 2 subunit beta [Tetrabaena socialis]
MQLPLLLLALGLALARGDAIRGLNPDLASHYTGAGATFSCISGVAKTIPFARVNDDYCDCADGSDEPGTSACHNGRFYCRNLGHEPRLLAAAFVDDGVCDCCDGADEAKGTCKNTCLQASAVHKEALKLKITQFEEALSSKAEYISKARTFKADLHAKSGSIENDVAWQQSEVTRLKAEVDLLAQEDAARRAEEDAQRAAEQAIAEQAAQQQPGEELATEEHVAVADDQQELGDAGSHEQRELQEEGEQALPDEREETAEERGRRIASQWTNDPDAAATPASQDGVDGEEQQEALEEEGEPETAGDYSHQHRQQEGEYDHGEWQEPAPEAAATAAHRRREAPPETSEWEDLMLFVSVFKTWASRWLTTLSKLWSEGIRADVLEHRQRKKQLNMERMIQEGVREKNSRAAAAAQRNGRRPPQAHKAHVPSAAETGTPLGAAKAALLEAENVLKQLEKDKQDIQTYLYGNLDFGPDDIFLAFADQCFSSIQTRWTYEICFFKDATQREGYTNTVTVGRWRGFSPDYKQILYGGGEDCWNVGPRTMTVSMSCGLEEQLSDGEEPGTCAYQSKFTSPALCDDSEVTALRRQLQNLEAFELEVQALIAKDEL